MAFISAKTILTTINILDEDEDKNKKIRHPKNEFQAFAYKLSKDFNDDKNLKIYMRLAKTVERSLMERAYSFAIDSNSDQKGRLFLWKLKQLRNNLQKEKNKKNFSYEFVAKQMSKFRDDLAEQTIRKSNIWQSKELYEYLNNFSGANSKLNILSIGPVPDDLFKLDNAKFYCIELSSKIVKLLKARKLKEKIIFKDFLKNTYPANHFDLILLNSYWQFIPLESELKYLSELKRVLKISGKIIINLKENLEDSQEWKALIVKDQEKEYFIKNETNHTFRTALEKCDFSVEREFMSGEYIVYILKNEH